MIIEILSLVLLRLKDHYQIHHSYGEDFWSSLWQTFSEWVIHLLIYFSRKFTKFCYNSRSRFLCIGFVIFSFTEMKKVCFFFKEIDLYTFSWSGFIWRIGFCLWCSYKKEEYWMKKRWKISILDGFSFFCSFCVSPLQHLEDRVFPLYNN